MRALLSPRFWGVHLLVLACVAVAGVLGAWQYDAWQERRTAEAADLTRLDPIPLAEAMGPDDPFPGDLVGRPVTILGTWVPDATVLVAGRQHDSRPGFWVVTPLAVPGPDDPAIPVVRGWTPTADSPPPPGETTTDTVGWLQPPESAGAPDDDPTDDVLPRVRVADLVQRVDQDLYSAYVVASEPTAGLTAATLEELPDAGRLTGARNFFYALEWWVFGGFAVFVWVRYLLDVRQDRRRSSGSVGSDA